MLHLNRLTAADKIAALDRFVAKPHEISLHRLTIDSHLIARDLSFLKIVRVVVDMIPAKKD